jgi:hypothetical protein
VSAYARETGVWAAHRNGKRIALIRCIDLGEAAQVDCEVYPADGGLHAGPGRAGPYRFSTPADAMRFVGEAVLALEYLGCDVA